MTDDAQARFELPTESGNRERLKHKEPTEP